MVELSQLTLVPAAPPPERLQANAFLINSFLYLSRACLGKCSVFLNIRQIASQKICFRTEEPRIFSSSTAMRSRNASALLPASAIACWRTAPAPASLFASRSYTREKHPSSF